MAVSDSSEDPLDPLKGRWPETYLVYVFQIRESDTYLVLGCH